MTVAAVLVGALASPAFAAAASSVSIISPDEGSFLRDNPLTISGTAPPGVFVCITVDPAQGGEEDCMSTQSNTDGAWSRQVALADGGHTVKARLPGETETAERNFTVDTQAPSVTINSGPDGLTNDSTPTFEFSVSEGNTTCKVDGAGFSPCTSPYTTAQLADGTHSFQVKATDQAQNVSPAATRSFTVDTTPPAVSVISGPGSTTDTTPTFGFAVEAGAARACRFDGAPFGPCSADSSHTPASPLALGDHVFEVLAQDAAGNSATATRGFTITVVPPAPDPAAPQTMLTKGPKRVRKPRVKFQFVSTEPGSTFLCKLDKRPFFPCSSPKKYKRLKPGKHRFFVSAKSPAGAIDFSPAKHKFKYVPRR